MITSWIIAVGFTMFAFGLILGIALEGITRNSLSDLKEGKKYFQDVPPSKIFFLREEGGKIARVFIVDENFSGNIICNGDHNDKSFLLRRKENKYLLTYL